MTINSKESKEAILSKVDKLSFVGGVTAVVISVIASLVGVFLVWGVLALLSISLSPIAYLLGVIAAFMIFTYRANYKLVRTHITSEITGAILREVQKDKSMTQFIEILRQDEEREEE